MALPVPHIWSDSSTRHVPGAEVWVGVRTPGTEVAERAHSIRAALEAAGSPRVEAVAHDDELLNRVHDRGLLDHLRTAYDAWVAAGYPDDRGQDRVVRTSSPPRGCSRGSALGSPPRSTPEPAATATTR